VILIEDSKEGLRVDLDYSFLIQKRQITNGLGFEEIKVDEIEKIGESGNKESKGNNEVAVLEPEKIKKGRQFITKKIGIR
jgi:hypothetical protein